MRKCLALVSLAALSLLPACGGGGSPTAPPPTTQPPAPAASITAVGGGALVVHPSIDTRFCCALATPVRVTESGGGTADWHYARMATFRRGVEVERSEANLPVTRVTPSFNQVVQLVFRLNSPDFDRIDITLGFGDLRDSRQFTVVVPTGSFSDVLLSNVPLSIGLPVSMDPI